MTHLPEYWKSLILEPSFCGSGKAWKTKAYLQLRGREGVGKSIMGRFHRVLFSSVQSLSHVQHFATPWTAAYQAFLSITNSQNLLKLMSIESMMPSNHLIYIIFFLVFKYYYVIKTTQILKAVSIQKLWNCCKNYSNQNFQWNQHIYMLLVSIIQATRLLLSTYIDVAECSRWLRGSSLCLQCGRPRFYPWFEKIPWRRKWQPTPVLLPGKSYGRRSLVGYSHGVTKSQTPLSDFTFTFIWMSLPFELLKYNFRPSF